MPMNVYTSPNWFGTTSRPPSPPLRHRSFLPRIVLAVEKNFIRLLEHHECDKLMMFIVIIQSNESFSILQPRFGFSCGFPIGLRIVFSILTKRRDEKVWLRYLWMFS